MVLQDLLLSQGVKSMNEELTEQQVEQKFQELEELEAQAEQLASFVAYDGDDKIVTSHQMKEIFKNQPRIPSLRSKLLSLDNMLDGFRGGEMVVVSGPTGQGKTTLLQTFTHNFAEQGINSVWFSYEVPAQDLFERFGDTLPFFTLPAKIQGGTLAWLSDRIWEAKAKYDVKVVFIDHLHFLLSMHDLSRANTSVTIGAVLREVKKMALETGCIIYLISHITKLNPIDPPTYNDLRDSSFTGQEADTILMTWRRRGNEGAFIDYNVLSVEKARRTGRTGKIDLVYLNGRFQEYTETPHVPGSSYDHDN